MLDNPFKSLPKDKLLEMLVKCSLELSASLESRKNDKKEDIRVKKKRVDMIVEAINELKVTSSSL